MRPWGISYSRAPKGCIIIPAIVKGVSMSGKDKKKHGLLRKAIKIAILKGL